MAELKMNCSDTNKNNITNKVKRYLNINLFKEIYSSNKRIVEQHIKKGEIQKALFLTQSMLWMHTSQFPTCEKKKQHVLF
jgi:hypothetical protein